MTFSIPTKKKTKVKSKKTHVDILQCIKVHFSQYDSTIWCTMFAHKLVYLKSAFMLEKQLSTLYIVKGKCVLQNEQGKLGFQCKTLNYVGKNMTFKSICLA